MDSDKKNVKKKEEPKGEDKKREASGCCYVVDTCGCYVDPCGCCVSSYCC